MADLLNTVDVVGDAALADSLIDRTIVELNDNVSSVIGKSALEDCTNLVSIAFPNVISTNYNSFKNCSSLKVADFRKLTSVGQESFSGCNALEALIIRNYDEVPTINYGFGACGIGNTGYIYVPSALVNNYKSASIWSQYSDYIRAIEDYPEVCSYIGRMYEMVTQVAFSDGSFSNPDWSRFAPRLFCCLNNRLIATWGSSGIYYSEDGEIWHKTNCKLNNSEEIYSVKYNNGLWVAGTSHYQNTYNRLMYSEDCETWMDSNIVNISGVSFYDIDYSDDMWVAAGQKGIYYSEDGKTWTKSDLSANIEKVFYGNGIFVAINKSPNSSSNGGLYYSEDGKTWTKADTSGSLKDLLYANGVFVASTSYYTYKSTDGKTWSTISLTGAVINSIHYINNKWFFSGTNGKIYCSDDLVTSVCSDSSDKYKTVLDMTFANHIYIAAATDNKNNGYQSGVFYSYDGINWYKSNRNYVNDYGNNEQGRLLCYYEKNHTVYLVGTNEFYRSRLLD